MFDQHRIATDLAYIAAELGQDFDAATVRGYFAGIEAGTCETPLQVVSRKPDLATSQTQESRPDREAEAAEVPAGRPLAGVR